jgi:hypothetical protein
MAEARQNLENRNSRRYAFLCLIGLLGFVVVFLFPLPAENIRATENKWRREGTPDSTIVVGNSVIDHVSRCDADRRTIPKMLGDLTGSHIVDLSYGGQQLSESFGYALQALRTSGKGPVVFFVSTFAFHDEYTLDLWTQLYFRISGGQLHATSLLERLAAGTLVRPATPAVVAEYSYKGKTYPSYDLIKDTYFTDERRRMACPETLGYDHAFIEANYWNNYVRSNWDMVRIEDFETLAKTAFVGQRSLLVVILPVNGRDIAALSPALAEQVNQRATDIVRALRDRSVPILDLTDTQKPDRFADRWCACGHLVQSGRIDVATRVAVELAARNEEQARAVQ